MTFDMNLAWLSRPAINLVQFAYPAYASFKALQTQDDDNDDRQWLCFWILIGFLNMIDFFLDGVLSWIPFYTEAKLSLIIWAQLPAVKGAQFIYEKMFEPYLKRYENDIDEALVSLAPAIRRHARSVSAVVIDKVGAVVEDVKHGIDEKKARASPTGDEAPRSPAMDETKAMPDVVVEEGDEEEM